MSLLSMKSPLGRPNCFHSSRKFPSWSKFWMRLLPRSPTNSRPLESMARACGVSNSPRSAPFLPQVLMNFPSFENFTMRALESPPCPSATKMSPFGAVRTSEGRLKVSGPSPATPALPSVSRTFPSALNFTTWWPLPSFWSASRRALDPLFFRGLARFLRLLYLLHGLSDLLLRLFQGLLGLLDFLFLERSGGGRSAGGLDAAAGKRCGSDDEHEPCHGNSFGCGEASIG